MATRAAAEKSLRIGYAAMAGESRAAEVDQPAPFGTGDGGRVMSIDRLCAYFGFTRIPFGRDLARGRCSAPSPAPRPSPA